LRARERAGDELIDGPLEAWKFFGGFLADKRDRGAISTVDFRGGAEVVGTVAACAIGDLILLCNRRSFRRRDSYKVVAIDSEFT
jgi:hypothetical protein